jgi:hypothetical protein
MGGLGESILKEHFALLSKFSTNSARFYSIFFDL